MKKNKKALSLVLILILLIGIGFASVSTILNFDFETSLYGNKWKVYFDNFFENDNSTVNIKNLDITEDKTELSFSTDLEETGDIYSFDIDIINEGTVNAMVESVLLEGLSDNDKKYFEYTVTYSDGEEIKEKDLLKKRDSETITITVKYREDIPFTELPEELYTINYSLTINYINADETAVARKTGLWELMSANAIKDTTIRYDYSAPRTTNDFANRNGEGLNVVTETLKEEYPIYFYRGNPGNNFVTFAGFCWNLLRTTSNGGVKIVYAGTINQATGACTVAPNLFYEKFNTNTCNLTSNAYMYGDTTNITTDGANGSYQLSVGEGYIFGNDIEYDATTKMYTLKDTVSLTSSNVEENLDLIKNKHYSCLSTSNQCARVKYYVNIFKSNSNYYGEWFEFVNGLTIDTARKQLLEQKNDSNAKRILDKWYEANLIEYTNKIKDDIYCNDLTPTNEDNGYYKDGDLTKTYYTKGYSDLKKFNAKCTKKYSYTVSDEIGNGLLKYPIGLLEANDVILAGIGTSSSTGSTTKIYIAPVNGIIATMTPSTIDTNSKWYSLSFASNSAAYINAATTETNTYLKPTIILKSNVKIESGTGTVSDPYVLK